MLRNCVHTAATKVLCSTWCVGVATHRTRIRGSHTSNSRMTSLTLLLPIGVHKAWSLSRVLGMLIATQWTPIAPVAILHTSQGKRTPLVTLPGRVSTQWLSEA